MRGGQSGAVEMKQKLQKQAMRKLASLTSRQQIGLLRKKCGYLNRANNSNAVVAAPLSAAFKCAERAFKGTDLTPVDIHAAVKRLRVKRLGKMTKKGKTNGDSKSAAK